MLIHIFYTTQLYRFKNSLIKNSDHNAPVIRQAAISLSHNSAPQDRCDRGTLGDGAAPSYLESLKWVAFISKFTRAYQTFFVGVNFYIFPKIKFYFLSKL